MRCPYLSSASAKICVEMEKAGKPAEISDFDYARYCNGNPFYCYHYREAEKEKSQQIR
jgi:V8-like Glu-specific endopeptidase